MGDIAAFVFHYVLLGLWVLFVWPALKVRGGGRVMAVVAVVAGVAATLYELWFWFVWSPVAPIRRHGLARA